MIIPTNYSVRLEILQLNFTFKLIFQSSFVPVRMNCVSHLVKESLPGYLKGLPIPDTVGLLLLLLLLLLLCLL